MPPKAKFTKAEIIGAALNIVRTEGYEALTSRALGTHLGSSARPIFTVFKNMEEVQQAMIEAAKTLYKEYVNKGLTAEHPFKGVGTQYILFSVNEPKLFLADEPTGALDSRSAQTLLETFTRMNTELLATIFMVTHDAFSASYCSRILFLKDGKIFHELIRGERTRRVFLNEILDVLSLTGGELSDVR